MDCTAGRWIPATPELVHGSTTRWRTARRPTRRSRGSLRTTCATAVSLAISAGANSKVVQAIAGHANASMTMDVYAGLYPADLDAVAESVSKLSPRWA